MRERKRATVRDLRRDNRYVLLTSLFFEQPCSRQELGEATGLSPGSISNVTRDLMREGIVIEADPDGRHPRALLQINPDHGYLIGVDIGETRVLVELFDLMMTERAKADLSLIPREHDINVIVDAVATGVDAVLASADVDRSRVLGVGVAVPGTVEYGPEALVHGQTFGWESAPLEHLLRSATSLPLDIDNSAKTMGQAEMWFGAGRGTQHAVVCLIGSGVGASVITNGHTQRDSSSSAGEWGHTTVAVGGRLCRCGSRGCLEAYAGAEAILDRCGLPPLRDAQESALGALLNSYGTSPEATTVLDDTVLYLGAGMASLINLFNPERIILGGWAGLLLGERLLPAIRAAARQHSLRHPFAGLSIELGCLGPDAVALGAASLPLERILGLRARASLLERLLFQLDVLPPPLPQCPSREVVVPDN
jgi:predicted NBD/HSP70 family sugar kinase